MIDWVKLTFITYRREMKGLAWNVLYDEFEGKVYDTAKIEQEIQGLLIDDDVTGKKGVYQYILTRNEKYLSIRAFSEAQKRAAYEKQQGICNACKKHFAFNKMEGDHIIPWAKGGKTERDNCQMLCTKCNREKGGKL